MKFIQLFVLFSSFITLSLQAQQWQGQWSSSFGVIEFIEKPIQPKDAVLVFGNYGKTGSLVGASFAGVLYGVFYDTKTHKAGKFTFTQDKTSNYFTGKWKYLDKDKEHSWNGSLRNHKRPKELRSVDRFRSFEGMWESNFGPLELIQNGVFVEGKYSNKGQIFAVYNQSNALLYGIFTNKDRYGLLHFQLNNEKNSFDGLWSWKTQIWSEQKWIGSKK
jgi:hypothetical protein